MKAKVKKKKKYAHNLQMCKTLIKFVLNILNIKGKKNCTINLMSLFISLAYAFVLIFI